MLDGRPPSPPDRSASGFILTANARGIARTKPAGAVASYRRRDVQALARMSRDAADAANFRLKQPHLHTLLLHFGWRHRISHMLGIGSPKFIFYYEIPCLLATGGGVGATSMQTFIPAGSREFIDSFRAPPRHTRGRVYVIDDNARELQFIATVLERAGYQTEFFESFSEFATAGLTSEVAAILIDVHLGAQDATDVLEFLRRSRNGSPIYLISGNVGSLEKANRFAEEIGLVVEHVFAKPFTGSQILDQIQRRQGALSELFEQFDVPAALEAGWLYPVLQPKLDLASGKIRSAEMLSRMTHPSFGVVSPQRMIGHMSREQTAALFMEQFAIARRHFEFDPRRGNEFAIALNVDAANLVAVRENLREVCEHVPHVYRNLIFEVTEEAMARISDEQVKMLYKLALDGAKIAIDDFGIGHSNFARLSRLPIAEIKIDKSLVQGCAGANNRRTVVRSIIGLAHELNARVVAEGVETIEDLQLLEASGCDEVQGFLIGRPMKIDKFKSYVAEFNRRGFWESTPTRS